MKKKLVLGISLVLVLVMLVSSCSAILGVTWLSGVWKLFGPVVLLSDGADQTPTTNAVGELSLNTLDGKVYFGVMEIYGAAEYSLDQVSVVGNTITLFREDGEVFEGTINGKQIDFGNDLIAVKQ